MRIKCKMIFLCLFVFSVSNETYAETAKPIHGRRKKAQEVRPTN